MEEQILKIIKESWNNYYEDGDTQYTVPEIVSHVFEFIEWLAYHSQGDIDLIGYWDAAAQEDKRVFCKNGSRSVIHDAMTLKEVYEYWLKNMKK